MRTVRALLRMRLGMRTWRPAGLTALFVAALSVIPHELAAQPANNNRPHALPPVLAAPASGSSSGALFPNSDATASPNDNRGRGAGANADFDSLIDLIVSTVATDTWAENGGGEADIRPFPGGVLVDAADMLRLKTTTSPRDAKLSVRRRATPPPASAASGNARRASQLRCISLPRLEREIARCQAARRPLDPSMLTLAGLERVRYIFIYPETGDLVLAGPAGNWLVDTDGRIVSTVTGQPVVRLDDLLVLLRRGDELASSFFGCSINPRQEALAKTQAFLASTSGRAIEPSERKAWLEKIRELVGAQDIEVFGVDPASRVANVLVEADYHMKLIGMGLADGVDGVESYLASIRLLPGQAPPSMSVLRWWFALNYSAIQRAAAGDAFELVGPGVRVLSENELLAEQGQRVHTGESEPLNRQFAESFTEHFTELAAKYAVYGELRNIFDLAMVVALIQTNDLPERVNWQPGLLVDHEKLRLPQVPVPRQVETVVNHRVINRRQIVAGVSGGVMVAPNDVLKTARGSGAGLRFASSQRGEAPPADEHDGAWWWDSARR